jgi:hypothetical protein
MRHDKGRYRAARSVSAGIIAGPRAGMARAARAGHGKPSRARDQPARVRMVRNARISVVGGAGGTNPSQQGPPAPISTKLHRECGFSTNQGPSFALSEPHSMVLLMVRSRLGSPIEPGSDRGRGEQRFGFFLETVRPRGHHPPRPPLGPSDAAGDPDRPLIAGFAREKQQADDDLIARASGESRRESETEDYGLNR